MALDGLLLHVMADHLQKLCPSRIQKIQNLSEEELLFVVHTRSGNEKLVINVHSNTNRIYTDSDCAAGQKNPSAFVMVLRKNLNQAILEHVEQMGFDRLLCLYITARNELGDLCKYKLYIELMGKYSNMVLVDDREIIVDALKRIPVYENSKRLVHPGARYTLPDPGNKMDPLSASGIDLNQSLVKQIYGFSPLLSREFIFRINNGQTYPEVLDELLGSEHLYIYENEYHCLPLTHMKDKPQIFGFMEGFHHLYREQEQTIRLKEQCGDVYKTVEKERNKALRKLPKLEDTLERSKDFEKYKEYGDLLFAYMYELEKAPTVQVTDFEGNEVRIPLDMRYSIKDNANRFYQKYHKSKRAIAVLEEQIEQCKEDIYYFTQLHQQLQVCSVEDALEIREELIQNRILRPKKQTARKKKKNKYNILCLEYKDAVIFVGKNNLQNHQIVSTLARKNDTWFHVKDYHGSHVLLKSEELNEELIRLCANLAAYYSQSAQSQSVPVNYCPFSQIKKIPGARMGLVSMKQYKTIYIDPDRTQIEETIRLYRRK